MGTPRAEGATSTAEIGWEGCGLKERIVWGSRVVALSMGITQGAPTRLGNVCICPSPHQGAAPWEHGPPTSFPVTRRCNPGKGEKEGQQLLPQQTSPSACRGPAGRLLCLALGRYLVPGGGRNMEIMCGRLRPGSGSGCSFGKSREHSWGFCALKSSSQAGQTDGNRA